MQLTLRQQLTQFAHVLQNQLFPALQEATGELDDTARRLVAVLEMIPLARFVPAARGWIGRPSKDRLAIACAFVAKAVYGFSLTRHLLQRLQQDAPLRRICGWKHAHQLPHESTFSRAFAQMELPQFVHEALIASTPKRPPHRPHRPRLYRYRSPRALSATAPPKPPPPSLPPHGRENPRERPARMAGIKAANLPPAGIPIPACTVSAA